MEQPNVFFIENVEIENKELLVVVENKNTSARIDAKLNEDKTAKQIAEIIFNLWQKQLKSNTME